MPPRAVLDLDDPDVGIEAHFAAEVGFDLAFGDGVALEARREGAIDRPRRIERGLRGRSVQVSRSVQPVDLHEYRSGLFGAAPPHRCERPLDMATPDIGGHPDRGFHAHRCDWEARALYPLSSQQEAAPGEQNLTRERNPSKRPVRPAIARTRQPEISPVTASWRPRSNRSIPLFVPPLNTPLGLTWP